MGGMPPTTEQSGNCHATQESPNLIAMPTKGNPRRTVRVDAETWDQFGTAAQKLGKERATLLRDYIHWLIGRPDAPKPTRPDQE